MMRPWQKIFALVLTLTAFGLGALDGQGADKNSAKKDSPRAERDKPVLIREPEKSEVAPAAKAPAQPDPLRAEQSLDVGNYYFKRKRYDAAIDRYKEAIQFKPNYPDAYKLLAKAYEKKNEPDNAIGIYQAYLEKFPTSGFAEEMRKEMQRLSEREKKKK